MNAERYTRVREIFLAACECEGAARERMLSEACAEDPALRAEVERLFEHAGAADSFLDRPALGGALGDAEELAADRSPVRIGPYVLGRLLGEGGFGAVYQAQQETPVRRRVALKLLKPGMDSRSVLARFAAERQALALMDHPCIAKVFDAGATETGRPYFAMELVDGVSITDYCAKRRLGTRERLALFVQVCEAVQHAHHKGVVHRDIKPSNVLVAEHEGRALPKVIDFGVAKAIGEDFGEQSVLTHTGQMLGTPAYMSPEQAGANARDVDTRSDVYSLGVLLYELLAGAPPFDPERLRHAGIGEILRILQEEEPPRPSERASTKATSASTAGAGVAGDVRRVQRELRGDLDWIAMKALEKDRERRYATPAELAADLESYLRSEPVKAGPPSASYRFRKFARRNAVAVGAVAAVMVALVIGLAGTLWQARVAGAERDRAVDESHAKERALLDAQVAREDALAKQKRAETKANTVLAVLEFTNRIFGAARPEVARGREPTLREAIDNVARDLGGDLDREPEVEAEIRGILGSIYRSFDRTADARPHLERAYALRKQINGPEDPDTLYALNNLAALEGMDGHPEQAATLFRQSLEACRRVLGDEHRYTQTARNNYAQTLRQLGRLAEAEPLLREALAIQKRAAGVDDVLTLTAQHNFASLLGQLGNWSEAESLLMETMAARLRVHGIDAPQTLETLEALGVARSYLGRLTEAERLLVQALDGQRRVLGDGHMQTLGCKQNLAAVWLALGREAEAGTLAREVHEYCVAQYGERDARALRASVALASVLAHQERCDEAEPLLHDALEVLRERSGPGDPLCARALAALAVCARSRGATDEALALFGDAVRAHESGLGSASADSLRAKTERAETLRASGNAAEAESMLAGVAGEAAAALPPDHWVRAGIDLARARCLADLGRAAEAQELVERSANVLSAALGEAHPLAQEARQRLAATPSK